METLTIKLELLSVSCEAFRCGFLFVFHLDTECHNDISATVGTDNTAVTTGHILSSRRLLVGLSPFGISQLKG